MTVANPQDFETGLEDFGIEDAVVPRLSIQHRDGEFKDSLSGATFPKIRVIILGLVKQRILWNSVVDDGDMPMCKSPNHKQGFPNVDEDTKRDKRFPWAASGFNPKDFPPDEDGQVMLPCDGCQLKEWGSHPDGKRPYCSEQFTLPVLYDPYDNEGWVPAILTFQKTSIKPVRSYLTSFARSNNPAYTAITEIGLDLQKRGGNPYSVPNFRRVGDTDEQFWREYATNYRSLKQFLTAPPAVRDSDSQPAPSANQNRPPATERTDEPAKTEAKSTPPAPAPAPAASATPVATQDDDEDLPF